MCCGHHAGLWERPLGLVSGDTANLSRTSNTFAGSDASTHSHERHGHRGERAGGTGSHTCMASSRRCQDRQESTARSKCTLAWGVLGKRAEQEFRRALLVHG